MYDVAVIGGGVIGLSIARELSGKVILFERGATGHGTSWAAAGMLSPQSEADEPGPFFELCLESLRMFPAWREALVRETGMDIPSASHGLLFLASSEEEREILTRRANWQSKAGLRAAIISRAQAVEMEPLITAAFPAALLLPDELSVAPRALTAVLRDSCLRRGVEIRADTRIASLLEVNAKTIVVASGVWSGEIQGLRPEIPLHPRKGQILSLAGPPDALRRMIRWRHSYLAPRPDGEVVVGATNEDAGFDTSLTPAGIGGLLADAQAMASTLGSWPIREMWSGLRPATPDGLPVIGKAELPGVIYATGHYRNGILLAPVTARIVAELIEGRSVRDLTPYAPDRFG